MAQQNRKRENPDHFLSLQIADPEIHRVVGEIQDHIVSQNAQLATVVIPPSTLHVTLMVIRLGRQYDLDRIKKALADCQRQIQEKRLTPLTLDLEGLGNFGNTVLFTKVKEGPRLEELRAIVEIVRKCFTDCGMPTTDDRPFQAHITIMKMGKDRSLYNKGIRSIDAGLYEKYLTHSIGSQTVTDLQLCSMRADEGSADGYYPIIHAVPLDQSLQTLPVTEGQAPTVPTLPQTK